ncbi:MAG TPA: hypothetical protein DCK93_03780 [Blastocatellia bacterium]|nr:hypothetical protein [Blastocatellia bacterium]
MRFRPLTRAGRVISPLVAAQSASADWDRGLFFPNAMTSSVNEKAASSYRTQKRNSKAAVGLFSFSM